MVGGNSHCYGLEGYGLYENTIGLIITVMVFLIIASTTRGLLKPKGAFKYYISTLGGGGGLKVICLYCLRPKGGLGG